MQRRRLAVAVGAFLCAPPCWALQPCEYGLQRCPSEVQLLLLVVLLTLLVLAAGRIFYRKIAGIWRRLAVAAGLAIVWLAGVPFILLAAMTFLGRCASTCW